MTESLTQRFFGRFNNGRGYLVRIRVRGGTAVLKSTFPTTINGSYRYADRRTAVRNRITKRID